MELNLLNMEKKAAQQEILLITDTAFAHRQWTEKDGEPDANLSARELLEKACWDGLIKNLLPELDIAVPGKKRLWLWEIHETHSFLALELSEFPALLENETSINPYLFLDEHWDN